MNIEKTFIHLRVHSNFSLAEGMLPCKYLADFCTLNLQPAIAITDTSNMFGVLEFSLEMISKGVQPIIGIQVEVAEPSSDGADIGEVVLIAKNDLGYKNLMKLSSNFSVNNNFDKYIFYNDLKKFNDGIILLTGGVENGFVGKPAGHGQEKTINKRLK